MTPICRVQYPWQLFKVLLGYSGDGSEMAHSLPLAPLNCSACSSTHSSIKHLSQGRLDSNFEYCSTLLLLSLAPYSSPLSLSHAPSPISLSLLPLAPYSSPLSLSHAPSPISLSLLPLLLSPISLSLSASPHPFPPSPVTPARLSSPSSPG